jgi:hypothetical protein
VRRKQAPLVESLVDAPHEKAQRRERWKANAVRVSDLCQLPSIDREMEAMSDAKLSSNELLACPFCGAGGMLAETNGAGHETYYTVLCAGECECDVGYFPIEHEARAAWNKRAAPEPRGIREALQSAADALRNMGCAFDADEAEEALRATPPPSAVPALRAALVHAVSVIQTWHNMGIPKKDRSALWDIYWRNSPEMQPIRAELTKGESL